MPRVPVRTARHAIRELGFAEKISRDSYWHAGHVYLEEDCDLELFFNAYNAAFGFFPKLRDRVARERRSRVRGYDPFGYRPEVNMFSKSYLRHVEGNTCLKAAIAMGRLEIIHVG